MKKQQYTPKHFFNGYVYSGCTIYLSKYDLTLHSLNRELKVSEQNEDFEHCVFLRDIIKSYDKIGSKVLKNYNPDDILKYTKEFGLGFLLK
jgi:excinuclease UvrABC nuclease subunit